MISETQVKDRVLDLYNQQRAANKEMPGKLSRQIVTLIEVLVPLINSELKTARYTQRTLRR